MWNMIGTASAFLLGLVAIAGAWAMGADWLGRSRAAELPRLTGELGLGLYQYHSMRPGIFGNAVIADDSIIGWHAAPIDFVDAANNRLVNIYAGAITVTGAGPRVHIDHDGIPREACVEILKNLGRGRGFESVAVAAALGGLSGAAAQTLPIDDASGLCTTDPAALRFTLRY